MTSLVSPRLSKRNVYQFVACLLSFSLIMMPFVPIAAASSRGAERHGRVVGQSSKKSGTEAPSYTTTNAAVPAPAPEPFAVNITATKVDALIGDDGDGKADPGTTEKIEYTVTVSNTGTTDATNVVFSDTIDAHTTHVAGSTNTQPIADPDTYSASGNIQIAKAAPGVLANDRDPDTGNATGLTVSKVQGVAANVGVATDTTATGRGGVKGSVTLNADGSFTYEPAPGFEGGDSFTYEITDGSKVDTATVNINISGMVWFISNTAGGLNRGTFTNPFTTLASFNGANAGTGVAPDPKNNDFISLRTGTYNEADGINLRQGQRLIGNAVQFSTVFTASADSSSAYTTFAGAAGAAPTINTTAGNGVDLALSNTVRGLNVGNTPGFFKVNGGVVGTPIIDTINLTGTGGALNVTTSGAFGSSVTFSTLESTSSPTSNLNLVGVTGTLGIGGTGTGFSGSAASSAAVNVSGGSVAFNYPGSVSKTNAGSLVFIQGGHSGGAITFSGSLSATAGDGLRFDNADSTYNFTGTTTLNGGDAGVDILNGSGGTFNFGANTSITNPSGPAFNVGTSPGAPNVDYNGTITQNSTNQSSVNIDGTTGGTITFDGAVTGDTDHGGIDINNATSTIIFTSPLTLGTSGARMTNQAITISGGGTAGNYNFGAVSVFTNGVGGIGSTNFDGTLAFTGAVNATAAAANTNAPAISIDGPAGLTTLNVTLTSVSANNAQTGVLVRETNGTFVVNGTGTTNGSGGTISNITNRGMHFETAQGITLKNITFTTVGTANGADPTNAASTCGDIAIVGTNTGCNAGIHIQSVSNISLDNLDMNGGSQQGINGDNVTNFTLTNSNVQNFGDQVRESGIKINNLLGTSSISNSTVSGNEERQIDVQNDTGTLTNLTIDQVIVRGSTLPNGAQGILFSGAGSASMKLTVTNSTFGGPNPADHLRSTCIQTDVQGGSPTMEVTVTGSTFQEGGLTLGAAAIDIIQAFSGNVKFDVSDNPTFLNLGSHVININQQTTSTLGSLLQGRINNNTIGNALTSQSGTVAGSGIRVRSLGQGTTIANITNNTVRGVTERGIFAELAESTSVNNRLDTTISNNTVNLTDGIADRGILVHAGIAGTADDGVACADILNNNAQSAGVTGDGIRVRQREKPDLQMPGYTGGLTDGAAVVTYLQGRNPATTDTFSASAIPVGDATAGFKNTPGGNPCTQPSLPSAPVISMASIRAQQPNYSAQASDAPENKVAVDATASVSQAKLSTEPTQTSFLTRAANALASFVGGITSRIEPTAHAAESSAETPFMASNAQVAPQAAPKGRTVMNHARSSRTVARNSSAMTPMMSGETITVNIGTLRAGDSVTITFQVTVDNPPNLTLLNPPRVRNQGSVTADGGIDVDTDDPALGGAADPTDTEVDLFDTTTTLVSDLNPSNFGEQVTFTATVAENPAQASADPTGTVDFIDTSNSNAVICNDVALSGGSAQCQTSSLTAGTHNIRADYSGDGNFDPSQSNIVAQVVNACTPDPIVTSTADSGAGSLREALANVCSGDTITFDLTGAGPHTITLTTGELVVGINVTINNNSGERITVSGNNASRVFNINATKTAAIVGLNITGGSTTGDGAGIINDGALTVVNSALFGNAAGADGGAISTTATGTSLTLINTTISGNSAGGSGGGLITLGGTVNIINTTITNNVADSDNNSAGTGGGIRVQAGTVTLKNTIVAGNFNEDGASDAADDISGTVDAASSFNLIGAGGAGTLVNGVNNNQVGVANAGLGPLADNGGTTQTHALLPTSTAVEAGSNANLPADVFDLDGDANTAETLSTDQRGNAFPRVADSSDIDAIQTVDIGAFELHPTVEDITDKSVAEDNLLSFSFNLGDGTGSLIQSVTATSGNTTLVPNANISVTGSGTTRTLDITPATNANSPADGTATITVTVTATNGRTAVDTFVLTVTEVNDNPVAVDDTLTAVDEDSGVRVIPFADLLGNDSPGPANESGQTLTITNVNNPVGGTVAINGTNVEFTLAANFFGTASFDYTVTDNGTTNGASDPKSDTGAVSFTVNPINDPPSFTIAADPPASNEDAGPQTVPNFATDISAGPNEVGQTLTFNITPNGSTGTLTFSSGPAIDATTGTLTYTATADTNGTATFNVTLSDNGSNTPPNSNTSAAQSFTITVNPENDNPVVTTTAGNLSYTENDPPTAIDTGLTVTDGDSTNLTGATVAITAGFVSAQDVLAFTNQLGITGNYNSGTGVLTLTGTTTVANYQTALRSVTYQNTSDDPTLSRTITFTANDGVGTGSATRGITINAVNDAPVNTVPGPQATNQNTALTFSSGSGNQISIADPDAGTNTVQVTLTAANGTITLSGTSGLSFSFSDGNGTGAGDGIADATMTFRGTIANINTALNGMTFNPTVGFSGAASLTITTNDLGNSGSGGPLTDTDVVNIQVSTNISIQDAQVVEPTSGSVNMVFTVTLSAPAPAGGASVNFTTQQEPPALNHATAGSDYTTTSGTVNFAAGDQVKTILVPVLADGNNSEANETFLVVLSSPVNAQIADGTATGTILALNQPGTLLISEIRTSGPAGAGDDFVEIYNNTDSPHTVSDLSSSGYGLFKMGATCNDTPVLVGVIPNGTVIPARGHFLFVGSAYSLGNYGGTGAAAGDQTLSSDLENDANVGFFGTTSLITISSVNRFDAVGFGLNTGGTCDLLREGTTLPSLGGSVLEHSFVRDECGKKGNPSQFGPCPTNGATKDTNVNNNDFVFVDTTATVTPAGQTLGAPGPQNIGSAHFTLSIASLLLDATKGAPAAPNRVRDNTPVTNGANGTLSIRRRFVNSTGAPVTRLRFRIVDISALATGGGNADIRVLSSSAITVANIGDSATCLASNGSATTPCTVTVLGTTLEQPPTQAMGGAYNSSLSAGTITLATPLAPGASINLQMLLGVQSTGSFKFFFNIEALP